MRAFSMWKYQMLRHLLPDSMGGGYYERRFQFHYAREIAFRRALRICRGQTFIDLGANVGHYTRIMSKTASRVIAFEPDPHALTALRNNVADLDNVQIEGAAAGVGDGIATLYRHQRFEENPTYWSVSSSIISSKTNVATENSVVVKKIDFIRYLQHLDEHVGILKVDIEGAEVDLLEALLDRPEILRRINFIFAETHEHVVPEDLPRIARLRKKISRIASPTINLDWH